MPDLWLQSFLDDAVQRRLCVRIGCTTCGAGEFRQGLGQLLAVRRGQPQPRNFAPGSALEVAAALATVRPLPGFEREYATAVRFLLYKIWVDCGDGAVERQIWPVLDRSWAGTVLQSMEDHARAIHSAKTQVANRQEQSAEKARTKVLRQAERAERKRQRDAAWRTENPADRPDDRGAGKGGPDEPPSD